MILVLVQILLLKFKFLIWITNIICSIYIRDGIRSTVWAVSIVQYASNWRKSWWACPDLSFEVSPIMSTYLMAVLVGLIHFVETFTPDGTMYVLPILKPFPLFSSSWLWNTFDHSCKCCIFIQEQDTKLITRWAYRKLYRENLLFLQIQCLYSNI